MPRCNCRFDSDETDSMDVYEMTTRRNQWGQSHHDYRKNATHTVDGRNPLVDVGSLSPLFTRFYTSQRISSIKQSPCCIMLRYVVGALIESVSDGANWWIYQPGWISLSNIYSSMISWSICTPQKHQNSATSSKRCVFLNILSSSRKGCSKTRLRNAD